MQRGGIVGGRSSPPRVSILFGTPAYMAVGCSIEGKEGLQGTAIIVIRSSSLARIRRQCVEVRIKRRFTEARRGMRSRGQRKRIGSPSVRSGESNPGLRVTLGQMVFIHRGPRPMPLDNLVPLHPDSTGVKVDIIPVWKGGGHRINPEFKVARSESRGRTKEE
ncbi:hypothetical protein B0H11DRAFT_1944185 [Mycena galericulata]|nr:hypothetical protein B0H11DRAFT_1944185 [Mycena galericulata]